MLEELAYADNGNTLLRSSDDSDNITDSVPNNIEAEWTDVQLQASFAEMVPEGNTVPIEPEWTDEELHIAFARVALRDESVNDNAECSSCSIMSSDTFEKNKKSP